MTKAELENKKMEIPKCLMCDTDYFDEDLSHTEIQEDFESIKEHGKCVSCQEEFGQGFADRTFK